MFQELTRANNDSTPRRVFLFSVLPVLIGVLVLLGWNYQMGSWLPWSASAATLAVTPPAAVTTGASEATDDAPIAATAVLAASSGDSTSTEPPITPVTFRTLSAPENTFDEEAKQNNEALALVTQKLQAAQAELAATRRELEEVQWNVTLWKQQVATSSGERDHALQEAKDLTEQLRQNFMELHVAQASLDVLEKQSAVDKERLSQSLKIQGACQNRAPKLANN
jgi:hypothetical protein